MCDHSICPAGREGISIISKRSYIEWAQPIYRFCTSKNIDTPPVQIFRFCIGVFAFHSKKSAPVNDFFDPTYCASDFFLL